MSEPTPVPVDPQDGFLDVTEAAAFLRVSKSWLDRSDVPRIRLGGRVVFLRSTLLRYGKQREGRAA